MDDAEKYDQVFMVGWMDAVGDKELLSLINKTRNKKIVYEPGCGTGLITEKIAEIPEIKVIIAVDPHQIYLTKAKKRLSKYKNVQVVCNDSVTYDLTEKADIITMRLVYHHIPDKQKVDFLKKLKDNLKPDGKILIMDVFIPNYNSEEERDESLRKFHEYKKSLVEGNEFLMQIEQESLDLGLIREDEYKISLEVFKKQAKESGLKIESINLIKDSRIDNPELNGLYILTLTTLEE